MRQSSVRGEGPSSRGRRAQELGWDDGLYDGHEDRDATTDAEDTSPGGDAASSGRRKRGGGEKRPRGKRRIRRWVSGGLAFLVLATAAAGYLYYQHLNGNLDKQPLHLGSSRAPEPTPNAAGQTPLNILLIGSDARDSEANQKLGGAKNTYGAPPLADVQMLLHLSADRSNMSVVSMPRDTLVKIPECTDPADGKVYPAGTRTTMANQSLGRGGPGCTVATWEDLTGIRIDHFMMVDFAGVVSMADAIGGVPVCVDANIHSRTAGGEGSGLKLRKGTTSIRGEQALQWLRTRYGFGDGTDISRAKAQHMYINSMVRELRENATLSSPNKLRNLAETATAALTVDDGLDTVAKLYDLGEELKKVPPSRTTMTTMPWIWSPYDKNRVEPDPKDAEQLFRLVREDIALDGKDKGTSKKDRADKAAKEKAEKSEDPAAEAAEIAVLVQNGTRTDTTPAVGGRASAVAQQLIGEGFARTTADATSAPIEAKTLVRYPSAELEGDAQAVAEALGIPLGSVAVSRDVSGVTLVVGADWKQGDTFPAPKEKDDTTPDSAGALNGSDDSACMEVDPAFTWE